MYELSRKTLIIVSCLMLSKILHLSIGVYIVLFAIILANMSYSKHIPDLIKLLIPSITAAIGAAFFNEFFSTHPFIIWTGCMLYFDHVRRRAITNMHIRQATLPLFMIIFVTTYHNSSDYSLLVPTFIRDILVNTLVAVLITSFINHIMPIRAKVIKPTIVFQPVTGSDRLKLLLLVGGGLAFIMINEVTSAVFCLVPLVTSAMQSTHREMKNHSLEKILSQTGGCSLAMIVSMIYSGTEISLFNYFIISFVLVYVLLFLAHYSEVKERAIHADALMGFLIPYQLYVAGNSSTFGLNSIALRAVELFIVLVIIYVVAHWLDLLGKTPSAESQ